MWVRCWLTKGESDLNRIMKQLIRIVPLVIKAVVLGICQSIARAVSVGSGLSSPSNHNMNLQIKSIRVLWDHQVGVEFRTTWIQW